MQTLATAFQTIMDGVNRHPIIDIVARSAENTIPFEGSLLTSEEIYEKYPNIISHSSGRLCIAYLYGPDSEGEYYLKYVYTDIDRTYFTTVSFLINISNYTAIGVDICEMTDGNIGLIYIENNTLISTYLLKQKIISVEGVEVSSATIDSWNHDIYTSGPTVCRETLTDEYIIAYSKINAGNYYLYKRTSSDFVTWSAETALSIAGLTTTQKISDPFIYSAEASSNDLFLFFSVVEDIGPNGEILSNIYYSLSTDGGLNWAEAIKITSYIQYGTIGLHPTFCEKEDGSGYLAFDEKKASQTMDSGSDGWPAGSGSDPSNIHFDSVNRKLYCVNAYKGAGTKALQSVVKIDVDTWSIDNYWTTTSTPHFDDYFDDFNLWYKLDQGAGQYVPLSIMGGYFCQLIDGESDTITTYAFEDIPAYEITANVTGWDSAYEGIVSTFVDLTNNRLWFLFVDSYVWRPRLQVGYISLDDSGPIYTFVQVVIDTDMEETEITSSYKSDFKVYPEADMIIIGFNYSGVSSWQRPLCIYNLTSGARIKKYIRDDYSSFPQFGLNSVIYKNGKVYGGITYYDLYGQENIRGLCEVDITTDVIRYHRPTFASVNNYGLGDMVATDNNKLLIASTLYGVAEFDLLSEKWIEYSNNTISGLTPKASDRFYLIDYDEENDFIFAGVGNEYSYPWAGWVMFSGDGYFLQTQYAIATKTVGWSFGESTPLVSGLSDYNSAVVCDPETKELYAFWTNENNDELSIKWAKDEGEFSLNDYLIRGQAITVSRSVDGSNNSIQFSVSDGHLFDPFNMASTLRNILNKGRLLVVKFGEVVDDISYWQNIGTFYITSKRMSGYKKGQYPTMTITGEDLRYIWKDKEIVATNFYDMIDPDEIISDLITDWTPLELTDLDLEEFDDAVQLNMQWTNTVLFDCIQQVCERFSYFLKVTGDNKITNKKIAIDNAVTHTYLNSDQILSINLDDSFSDFTNRIVVEGQKRDYIEVLYDEEMVGALNGTVGWWGFKKDYKIYYSEDQSRRCQNPRLSVLESATSIGFKLAGNITESLTDTTEQYCTITVSAPSLVPYLIGLIALKLASGMIGDLVIGGFGGGWTHPIGTYITNFASVGIMLVLGASGNFQYEVYANPIGEVKRSVEGEANDLTFQTRIGYVVEKRMEDPFCYSVSECSKRAQRELDVVMAQRNRITIEKITHLQDEEGDTILFVHPISGQNLRVFVTDLTRSYTIPSLEQTGDSPSCIDNIEGWVIE
ncbi:MAG: sialidase family protein [Eubacteriales bacterium]